MFLHWQGGGTPYQYTITQQYLLEDVNDSGTPEGDNFGYSVATNGTYAVVGAPRDQSDFNVPYSKGRAFLFNVSTGSLVRTLISPLGTSGSSSQLFGWNVAMNSTLMAISAPSVPRVYVYNISTGALVYTLTMSNGSASIGSTTVGGSGAVAMNESYIAIGNPRATISGSLRAGSVAIYNLSTGSLVTTFTATTPSANTYFGNSVAIYGNTLLVTGAVTTGDTQVHDITTGSLTSTISYGGGGLAINQSYAAIGGSSGVNIYNTSDLSFLTTVTDPTSGTSGFPLPRFGRNGMALKNEVLIVGTEQNEPNTSGTVPSGAVLMITIGPNRLDKMYSQGDLGNLSHSISASGDYVIAGAPFSVDSTNTYADAGKAYVYTII
jgi:hypothetical protein